MHAVDICKEEAGIITRNELHEDQWDEGEGMCTEEAAGGAAANGGGNGSNGDGQMGHPEGRRECSRSIPN